jgi:Nucleotidyl transferase AbiEii toxin, Type IV TA system
MLTPLQRRVAAVFAAIPLRNAFVLAGGAALDVYGITNRRTEDLDFFSCESERVAEAAEALTVALRRGTASPLMSSNAVVPSSGSSSMMRRRTCTSTWHTTR